MSELLLAEKILETLLDIFGPIFVKERINAWEAARKAADAAAEAKFGEKP